MNTKEPDQGISGDAGNEVLVGKNGKHELPFEADFPILLKRYRFSSDYHITPNYHDFFEISLIKGGRGFFWSMGKKTRVTAGDAFIVGDNQFHSLEADLSAPLRVLCVYFLPEYIYKPGGNPIDVELIRPFFYPPIHLRNFLAAGDKKNGISLQHFEGLEEIASSREPFAVQHAKIHLSRMLLEIARRFSQISAKEKITHTRRFQDIRRLRPVFDFLQNHLSCEIDLNKVAHLACMSPSYLCRFFKRVTGSRLMEYLIRMRIDKAKELLLKGELSVTQIALETGFKHLSYFDRIFRKYTRLSPQEFVRLFSS